MVKVGDTFVRGEALNYRVKDGFTLKVVKVTDDSIFLTNYKGQMFRKKNTGEDINQVRVQNYNYYKTN